MFAYLIAAALFALIVFVVSFSVAGAVLGIVLGGVIAYCATPTLALPFLGLPAFASVAFFVGLLARMAHAEVSERRASSGGAVLVGFGVLLWGVAVPLFSSAPMLHAEAYRALIGPVDTIRNAPDMAPVDPAHLRIVDGQLAELLAERVLGTKGALGSQATVGRMDLQIVRERSGDQWFWVAPLNHGGLFAYLSNQSGTPGFIMVSASDPRDVRLITEVGGAKLAMRYNMGAFFDDSPDRYLYEHGYASKGVRDFSFEVDDNLRPYYVATEYEPKVGFSGAQPVAAILLDVQTGAITSCAPAACPDWVDLIQPADMTLQRINDWGQYVHGWYNPSHHDMLQATDGMTRILGRDGQQYHYSGITSVSSDNGTTGYMLMSTRTGKATYYLQAGATEEAAMASARGSVQEKGYTPVPPTPYDVGGTWSYLVPLKDHAGFVKAVAFVSVANDQVIGVGETAEAALRKYRSVLAAGGRSVADDKSHQASLSGVVIRFAADVRQGETTYYLTLSGHDSIAFAGGSSISPALPLTQVGDRVTVRYEDTGRGVDDLLEFQNPSVPLRRSAPEEIAAAASTAGSPPVPPPAGSTRGATPHSP